MINQYNFNYVTYLLNYANNIKNLLLKISQCIIKPLLNLCT